MPTFLLFKDGKQIQEIKGADPRSLKAAIEGASGALKSSGATPAAAPKAQEEKPAEKKASNDDGLSMLERLMQKNKK